MLLGGQNYEQISQMPLRFGANVTSLAVDVATISDSERETNEDFLCVLSLPETGCNLPLILIPNNEQLRIVILEEENEGIVITCQ